MIRSAYFFSLSSISLGFLVFSLLFFFPAAREASAFLPAAFHYQNHPLMTPVVDPLTLFMLCE
jgi:hypothetical protein